MNVSMPEEKKVLIVEDNELNLKLFNDLLDANGYLTIETRKGDEALDLAIKEKPDLIIMDIQLPNISGIDVIKSIKKNNELKNIPIIAVTAFAMQDDEQKILNAGCEGYLAKPISIESFVQTIKKFL